MSSNVMGSFILLVCLVLASCGAPKPPEASKLSEVAGVNIGAAECRVPDGEAAPMLVDWPAVEKTTLEGQAAKGIVAVRYDQCKLEVVRGCSIPGGYEFVETARARDGFVMRDRAELSAKLPLSVASLEGHVGGGTNLSLDYITVGTRGTRVEEVTTDLLSGNCAGATHYVRTMVMGAYQLSSAAAVGAGAGAQAGSAGGGISGGGESAVLRKAGNLDACTDDSVSFKDMRCQAIVQLILEPIGKGTGGAASPLESGPPTVAVSYFDNTSGDSPLEPLRKGLADMLITDLSSSTTLRVVEREKLESLLGEIKLGESNFIDARTAQTIGKGLGAQLILTGSYLVQGGQVRLDARVVRVETGEIVAAQSEMGTREGFFEMERNLVAKLIPAFGTQPTEAGRARLAAEATAKFDAVLLYSKGLDQLDAGRIKEAKELLRQAVKKDDKLEFASARLSALEATIADTFAKRDSALPAELVDLVDKMAAGDAGACMPFQVNNFNFTSPIGGCRFRSMYDNMGGEAKMVDMWAQVGLAKRPASLDEMAEQLGEKLNVAYAVLKYTLSKNIPDTLCGPTMNPNANVLGHMVLALAGIQACLIHQDRFNMSMRNASGKVTVPEGKFDDLILEYGEQYLKRFPTGIWTTTITPMLQTARDRKSAGPGK